MTHLEYSVTIYNFVYVIRNLTDKLCEIIRTIKSNILSTQHINVYNIRTSTLT